MKDLEQILDYARKVQRLAERGSTEAEKGAALNKLNAILDKHHLTIDDLSEAKREWVKFLPKDEFEREILFQCAFKVLNAGSISYRKNTGKSVYLEITPAEQADIQTLFCYYRNIWKQEVEDFLIAFMHKHSLYPETSNKKTNEPIDFERLERLMNMMAGMREAGNPLVKALSD